MNFRQGETDSDRLRRNCMRAGMTSDDAEDCYSADPLSFRVLLRMYVGVFWLVVHIAVAVQRLANVFPEE